MTEQNVYRLPNRKRWFSWGTTVAVVYPTGEAFSVQANGWGPVSAADVGWDGLEISEAEAREFSEEVWLFGAPPQA